MFNFLILIFIAFAMEVVDSGLGMGYGTVLSPFLIILGYPPVKVIPAILFSQAIGGITASFFHQKYQNADFKPVIEHFKNFKENLKKEGFFKSFTRCFPKDLKIVILVTIFGITASIFGAFTAIKIPSALLKTYIGGMVLTIGIMVLSKVSFRFSWKKIFILGIISAFNKGLSGGGFGPLMTGGQIISGNQNRNSIGVTTLSEAPICLVSFFTYFITKKTISCDILILLTLGAFFGGILGPLLTKKMNTKTLRLILGILITLEGLFLLIQVFFKIL